MNEREIYLDKIAEAWKRLDSCRNYLEEFTSKGSISELESGVLQLRKAMECIAYSSIAPNIVKYREFREKADKHNDYRKDFNGNKMLKALGSINKDFYPITLYAPKKQDEAWHFERRTNPFSLKSFIALYDRLGKFLHADNPWGNDKCHKNLADELPDKIDSIKSMLSLYSTVIRAPNFSGVWVIEIPKESGIPKIITGQADGEFCVSK